MRGHTSHPEVVLVVGTRPEAIKVAPLALALQGSQLQPFVVSTGQHRHLIDQVLTTFDLRPDLDLKLGRPRQTLASLTASALTAMVDQLQRRRPASVVVQGDTTTAFAAGLAACYAAVPLVHLEAGLRSGDLRNPFPEEANRRLTGVIADLHLAPTWQAQANLLATGVDPATIAVTGNTVIDALLLAAQWPVSKRNALLSRLEADPRRVVLVTMHRRESWGAPMRSAMSGLARVAAARPDVVFVVPVHPNPTVSQVVRATLAGLANVRLTDPLDYAPLVAVLRRSSIVLTDSGGLQEEAPSLGRPVLVMRETTERPEGIAAGTARLVGTDPDVIETQLLRLLDDEAAYAAMARAINPYGDGQAAGRCVAALEHLLGLRAEPAESFVPVPIDTRTHTRTQESTEGLSGGKNKDHDEHRGEPSGERLLSRSGI